MNNEVATYAVSSTLTIIVFVSAIIGVFFTINFIYGMYRLRKSKKIVEKLKDVEIITFDKKGIPVLIRYKDNKDTKWINL